MAPSRKKVVVRRFTPGLLWGYLPAADLLQDEMLALLDLNGRVHPIPLSDVKYVSYVREFNTGDSSAPERLLRKTFAGRPRGEGLWLRLTLNDGDRVEGLAQLDLSFADGWAADLGVHLVPPDTRGNTQRLYVPRSAIAEMEVLSVVTSPSRRKVTTAVERQAEQADLFDSPMPPGAQLP